MYSMRNLFRTLVLAALAAGAVGLRAQNDGPPPGGFQGPPDPAQAADRQLKQLTKVLSLTADQQTPVKTILTDEEKEIQALFQQSGGPPSPDSMQSLRSQMKVIRDAANTKIAALLTDTQKTAFSSWLAKHQRRNSDQGDDMPPPPDDGNGPPDGGGGPPPGGGGPPDA